MRESVTADKKAAPVFQSGFCVQRSGVRENAAELRPASGALPSRRYDALDYVFFAFLAVSSSNAACAAARRATGTRNGEQLT